MKLEDIRELVQLLEASQLEELELEKEGARLRLKKTGVTSTLQAPLAGPQSIAPAQPLAAQTTSAVTAAEAPAAESTSTTDTVAEQREEGVLDEENLHKIVAPMVGTFYQASAPDAEPYVRIGDHVDEKTVVCIVEAMKLMNEIEAEVNGEIVKVLVENGQLVEYGQPLFLVKTN